MSRRIFRSIMAVALSVLAAGLLIAGSFFYGFYASAESGRLREELLLASVAAENEGVAYFDALGERDFRFTLVSDEGMVLYDSMADVDAMENHLDREEISEALNTGYGSSVRYSTTLTRRTSYEAVRLNDGSVLRIASTQFTLGTLITGMLPAICAVILISVVTAIVLSQRMAKSLIKPIEAQDERNRREFTANVSHELKTPLQTIIGSAELLETGLVKPEDTPRFVGNIKSEAERLVALINDIIRLSRLDEGAEMPTETVNLHEVAEEVIDALTPAAEKRNVSLGVIGEASLDKGIRRYIYEIIYNLCDNAIRYNVEGGKVNVTVKSGADCTVISVSDTGIGIPREHQERVFERFYRVDKSHSRETGGTGLGLSIVKHAAACQGGTVTLESTVGKGTTVNVVFGDK